MIDKTPDNHKEQVGYPMGDRQYQERGDGFALSPRSEVLDFCLICKNEGFFCLSNGFAHPCWVHELVEVTREQARALSH